MLGRLLNLLLSVPSPSLVHMARIEAEYGVLMPSPRTWLERREHAFARRWLVTHPVPTELREAEQKLAALMLDAYRSP